MNTDYHKTGRLYNKLDAYVILKRKECEGAEIYHGSSNMFKTQKAYKEWLRNHKEYGHLTFKIIKGE